jgi:hypothetical protein
MVGEDKRHWDVEVINRMARRRKREDRENKSPNY